MSLIKVNYKIKQLNIIFDVIFIKEKQSLREFNIILCTQVLN